MIAQTEMVHGVPIKLAVSGGQYAYFKYALTKPTTELTIQVLKETWSFGDPDLFVSKSFDRPNVTHNEWSGSLSGADVVRIANPATGSYYISVRAWGFLPVQFTLTAKTAESSSFLIVGTPQAGSNLPGKYDYYKFDFGGHASQVDNNVLEFVASPSYGTVQLYGGDSTNQFPTSTNNKWAGQLMATSSVKTFEAPVPTGMYYLSVLSVTNSTYTITASIDTRYTAILSGQSYLYTIRQNRFRKFYFDLVDESQPVTISLYSYNGDADLFVGIDKNVDDKNYIWRSTRITNDVVSIEPEDKSRHVPAYHGRYYIAILGFRNSYFSLSVATNGTSTIEEGVTVRGNVQHKKYNYYRFWLNLDSSLIFNLRAIKTSDDPDIFVSTEQPQPTDQNFQWRSTRFGSDYINIPNAWGQRWYYIGVHGYSPNTTYLLTVSTDFSVLSGAGYASFDYVPAGQYKYYSTNLESGHISATVTLITGHTEIYMLHNDTKPSKGQYVAKDDSWPGNFVELDTTESGYSRWTYAVYGVEDSAYFISTVSSPDFQGSLRMGEPRLGVATNVSAAIFRYNSWFRSANYYVSVNLITEDVIFSIYMDQHNKNPNATNSKWKDENKKDDVVFSIPQDQLELTESFYITVTTTSGAPVRFQVLMSDQSEPIYLTQEQPNKFRIEPNNRRGYEIYSLPGTTGFTALIDSCDDYPAPEFYMSIHVTQPNSTSYDQKSAVSPRSKYSQVMASSGTRTTDQLYYVATDIVATGQYGSIYATTKQDMRPIVTGGGVIAMGDMISTTQLRLIIPAAAAEMNRLPITYEVFKRVLTDKEDPSNVNMDTACSIRYRKGNSKVGEVDVPPNLPPQLYFDLDISSNEKYLINIIARDRYGLETVYKQLGFNVGDTHILVPGKPLQASVNESQYEQFVLPAMPQPLAAGEELIFILTPISGDVDMYLSTTTPPTKEHNDWKAENGGYDVIKLTTATPGYKNDKYYIGIFGASERKSTFTIMAYVKNSLAMLQLEDGLPQVMHVAKEDYNYFSYYLDDNSTFSVTVAPLSGDPDVYVASNYKPSRTDSEWSSAMSTLDFVVVGPDSPKYKQKNTYQMAVYGWKESLYTITATKQFSSSVLAEGIPHGGSIDQNEFAYFKFTLASPRSVTFTVTSLIAEGDPDMLISTEHERPNSGNAMWRQERIGQDTITIAKTDPNWIMGTYYIAVKAFRRDLTFQIVAMSEIGSTVLPDGNVQSALITAPGETKYFRFYHGFTANAIIFTATPETSQTPVQMYVSHTISKPGPSKAEYTGQADGVNTVVTVPKDQPVGWWYCAVTAPTVANFTITAKSNQRAQVLVDGVVNSENFVANGYYVYFVYDVSNLVPGAALTISTMVNYGDPDLYVSVTESRPTKEEGHYTWRSIDPRADSISIPYNDLKNAQNVFIGAYGFFADASFSILAFSSNATIELRDNTVAPGMVPGNGYSHYKYEMTNKGRLRFTLDVLSAWPANVDMYIGREPNPSKLKYEWKSELFGQDFVLIDEAQAGMYYIGIYAANRNPVTFHLLASTEYATIAVGSTTIDFVDQGNYRYYQSTISPNVDFIMISVTLISGRTTLVMNNNETRPTLDNYNKKVIGWPGNSLIIAPTDPAFKPGTWSIGVYAVANSDYFLSIQAREGRLTDGQPRTSVLNPQYPVSRFSYSVGTEPKPLYIHVRVFGQYTVTETNSTTCIVIYGSQTNVNPTVDDHKWEARSDKKYGGQVVMPVDGLVASTPLYLSVSKCPTTSLGQDPSQDVHFEITSTGLNDPIYLTQDYLSIYSFMNNDFTLLSSRHAFSMNIEYASCDNNPMTGIQFLADANRNADLSNASYISHQTGTFSAVVASTKAILTNQPYFVKVIKSKQATSPVIYSLYASTTGGNSRPVVEKQFEIREISRYNNAMGILVAQTQIKFNGMDSQKLRFNLMAVKIGKEYETQSDAEVLKALNFETLCAVQLFPHAASLGVSKLGENFVVVEFDAESRYLVNAVVTDVNTGLQSVYTPVVLSIIPIPFVSHGVSVGGILIFIVGILFAIYLVVGSCWNYFRLKHRGFDIIPHVSFWADLPYLVWDGMKFVATCGRRHSNYESFDDDTYGGKRVNVEEADFNENPFKLSQVDEKSNSTHGYGAI